MRVPLKVKNPSSPAVLRNLTTKVYVVDETVAKSEYAFNLGEVIVTSSQWADDPWPPEHGLGCEGRWAGHRFAIATVVDATGGEWRDVSNIAVHTLEIAIQVTKRNKRRV